MARLGRARAFPPHTTPIRFFSASVTVTPEPISLSITTFAPTVTATTNTLARPSTLALSTTKFAPQIQLKVIPPVTALTLTAFAPTVTTTANVSVVPTTLALMLSPFAPTITATTNVLVRPATLALTLTTFAPTVSISDNKRVVPDKLELTLTAFEPDVAFTANVLATPATLSLTLAAFAPQLREVLTPDAATLSLTSFAPTLNLGIIPATLTLTLTTFEPTITTALVLTPDAAALVLATFPPTVTATSETVVTEPIFGGSIGHPRRFLPAPNIYEYRAYGGIRIGGSAKVEFIEAVPPEPSSFVAAPSEGWPEVSGQALVEFEAGNPPFIAERQVIAEPFEHRRPRTYAASIKRRPIQREYTFSVKSSKRMDDEAEVLALIGDD